MSSSARNNSSSTTNKNKTKKPLLNFNVILSLSDENYLTKDNIVTNLGLLNTYPHIKTIMLDIGEQDNSASSLPDGLKFVTEEIKDQFSKDIKLDLTNDLINNKDSDISKNYIFITDDIIRLDNKKFEKMKQQQRYVSILCKKDNYIITEVLKFLQTLKLDPNTTLIDIDNPIGRKPTENELKLYQTIQKSMKMKEDIPYLKQDGGSGELKIRISGTQPPELNKKDILFFYHNEAKSIKLLTKLFKQDKIKIPSPTKKIIRRQKKTKKRLPNLSIKRLPLQNNTAVSERVKNYNNALSNIDQDKLKKKEELNQKLDIMSDLLKDLKNENDEKKVNDINRQINELHNEIQELIPQQSINQNTEKKLRSAIVDVKNNSQLPNLNNKLQNLNIERNNAQKQAIKNIEEKERLRESKKALKKQKKDY